MSTFAHAAGNSWGNESIKTRIAEFIGHHAAKLLVVSIFAAILLGLRPLPGVVGLIVPIALFAFVVVSFLLMRQHDRRLCEKCMSAMPLDAAEKATRYQRRFWTAHAGSEPRYLIPYLVVLLGSNFLTSPPGRAVWAVIQLSMIYLIMAQSTPPPAPAVVPAVQRRRWRRRGRDARAGAAARRPSARVTPAADPALRRLNGAGLEFVTERHLATLTTLRADGSPHVTPVGFTWDPDGPCARVICSGASQKARNAERRGSAVLCQVDGRHWLTIEGQVEVQSGRDQVADAVARYALRYRQPRENPSRVALLIRVTRLLGSPDFFA